MKDNVTDFPLEYFIILKNKKDKTIKMKKITITFFYVLLFSCMANITQAQTKGFGLGIIIGEPTGVSGKGFLSHNTAIDGAVAWSFVDEGSFHIHGDFLLHDYDLISVDDGRLPVYYGIGGRIKFKNKDKGTTDDKVGIRVPVGLAYEFPGNKVDIFLEVVPVLDLSPKSQVTVNASLGARYYF